MSNAHPKRGRQLTGRLSGQPLPQLDSARGTTMYPRNGEHIERCAQCKCPAPEHELNKARVCQQCRRPPLVVPAREQLEQAAADSIRRRFPRNSSRAGK